MSRPAGIYASTLTRRAHRLRRWRRRRSLLVARTTACGGLVAGAALAASVAERLGA